ncbi:topoisomerase 3-alpha [Brevipalpus obovatus]|uniref:topoisomerase 3-alpha n=1 Tax=Brevipalpus obovatus TaxID=246614 RepID=UPI003D9DBFC8
MTILNRIYSPVFRCLLDGKSNRLSNFRCAFTLTRSLFRPDETLLTTTTPTAKATDCGANSGTITMKVLNVAEKNDAAKNLANIMSRGSARKREGMSKFNKIYEFDHELPLFGHCQMVMTSVSGHLLEEDFAEQYRRWYSCSPAELFDAPLVRRVSKDMEGIKRTLHREIAGCQLLIIWTDCDREGENIGFEIIEVCRERRSNIRVLRARFSEITFGAINNAINNLVEPNEQASNAVWVRRELDLRIGAAFTRFQTLLLQKLAKDLESQVISYGPCQFPTLGFVVERYRQIKRFVPHPFWYLDVRVARGTASVNFIWDRFRLFDLNICMAMYSKILQDPRAHVVNVNSKTKTHWRPQPMDTVTLEKLASSKLRITAKKTMQIAEKLYTSGFISYPRTETNIFPSNLNLKPPVEAQAHDPQWGDFAQRVLQEGIRPRQGKKTDNAHPPIYPIKAANDLAGDEKKVYELIVRHFLACVSQDAVGFETTVKIVINEEGFHASGLVILDRNYLEVYPYVTWTSKEMPEFRMGEIFVPDEMFMREGKTTPPRLLTESDLISLMEKHGIGTDATHADHIETIKVRGYVELTNDKRFLPRTLGLGLVEGYEAMEFFDLSRPKLRAAQERDLQAICDGEKNHETVRREQIAAYRQIFIDAQLRKGALTNKVRQSLNEQISIRA